MAQRHALGVVLTLGPEAPKPDSFLSLAPADGGSREIVSDDGILRPVPEGSVPESDTTDDRPHNVGVTSEQPPIEGSGRVPGWYPLGSNPNEQSYWDGSQWMGARQWVSGAGWIEGGTATASHDGPARLSANPYVKASAPVAPPRERRRQAPATFSLAVLLTVVAGIGLMYGSVGTWVQVNGTVGVIHFQSSLNGVDQGITSLIGVNGYVTLIGGIVVLVLGGLALSSEERLLVILTALVTLAILIFAVYDMFRTVQKIQALPAGVQPHVSVGWGLICVLSSAVLAMLVTIARLLGQR